MTDMRNLVYDLEIHWEKKGKVSLIITYALCFKTKTWAIGLL